MTTDSKYGHEEVPEELAELHLPDKPDGPGAAAMLAAGIGVFLLGLFTVLSELSDPLHDFFEDLAFDQGVGPLAGKTILAVTGWLVAWAILAWLWKGKDVDVRRIFWIGLGVGLAGAILMLPPVFTSFG